MAKPSRTLVDLCCGLGGLSKPFRHDPSWRVITVDHDIRVKPDVAGDIRALPLNRPAGRLFLWASIPCDKFSRRGQPGLYPDEPDPDLSCAIAYRNLIATWRPEAWALENVLASRQWLNPIFGPPRCVTREHVFWGTCILWPHLRPHKKNIGEQRGEWLRKLKRAKLPAELGEYLARHVLANECNSD